MRLYSGSLDFFLKDILFEEHGKTRDTCFSCDMGFRELASVCIEKRV